MNPTKKIIGLLCLVFTLTFNSVNAQQEGFLGEVKMFAGNFAPRGWAYCQGQLLPISQYQALFSILGCQYGGDCRTTFALPDFRGRVARGTGTGPGLQPATLAQRGGTEFKTLSILEMPIHNHNAAISNISASLNVNEEDATTEEPSGRYLGNSSSMLYNSDAPDGTAQLGPGTITVNGGTVAVGQTGGSQSFDNRQPFNTINYIICIQGVFPSRN